MNTPQTEVITLKSKLMFPHLDATLERERLLEMLRHFQRLKLIGIVAGAGYGKSTLAAQLCRSLGMKTVWYRLDSSDGDIVTLMHYLIAGIRQHYPSFGTTTLDRLKSFENLAMELSSFGKVLLYEMEQTIDAPLALVLDDFHLVQDHQEVPRIVNFLLANLPEQLHLIVISRSELKIDLANLVVKRKAVVIGEKELSFTAAEIRAMCQHIFQRPLADQELEILCHKTNGWVAGLVLSQISIQQHPCDNFEQRLNLLDGTCGIFEEYLEQNILALLPSETIAFLLQTSCLPHLEVACCNQLFGIDNAGQILHNLEKQHLFTFTSDHDHRTYYYHHLFRDFLKKKLVQRTAPTELKQLYCRTAELMQANREFYEAISLYLKAEAFDAASELLIQEGFGMLEKGQINQVRSVCAMVPKLFLKEKPWLMCLLGVANIQCGSVPEAIESFKQAHIRFEKSDNQEGAGYCLARLGYLYHNSGDFDTAENVLEKALTVVSTNSNIYYEVLTTLIVNNAVNGKLDIAYDYYQKITASIDMTQESPELAEIYFSYCMYLFVQDDASQLVHYSKKMWKVSRRFKNNRLMSVCCMFMSHAYLLQGKFELSYSESIKGIETLEKYGYSDHYYSWCHLYAALSLLGAKNFSKALVHCRYSLENSRETLNLWNHAFGYATSGFIYAKLGDTSSARTFIQKAMDAIAPSALFGFDRNHLITFIAWALLNIGESEAAMAIIQPTIKYTLQSKPRQRWRALFFIRWNWQNGHLNIAKKDLKDVLKTFNSNEKDFFLIDQQDWIIPLLVEIYAENNYREKITALLLHFRPESLTVLNKLCQSEKGPLQVVARSLLKAVGRGGGEPLHIRCFGAFKLVRGDVEITSDQWISSKAKTLFKYLALHADKGFINKDHLLELLWPEQDPAVTTKRLNVALSTIRKVLEPGLTKGEKSSYLIREQDGYKLSCKQNGFVDVVRFDQFLTKAKETIDPQKKCEFYLSAEKFYRGLLFADETFSDWCVHHREKYQEKYIHLLTSLANHYQSINEFDQSIEYLRRVLEIDDCNEEIYCRLMMLYQQTGNSFMAKRTYEKCKSKLEQELDCPISDNTQRIYDSINGRCQIS